MSKLSRAALVLANVLADARHQRVARQAPSAVDCSADQRLLRARRRWRSLPAFALLSVAVFAATAGATPAQAATVACGQQISTDTVLDQDLVNCPNDGLDIAADNVTLDLGGHTIDGEGRGTAINLGNAQPRHRSQRSPSAIPGRRRSRGALADSRDARPSFSLIRPKLGASSSAITASPRSIAS